MILLKKEIVIILDKQYLVNTMIVNRANSYVGEDWIIESSFGLVDCLLLCLFRDDLRFVVTLQSNS